MTNTNPKLLAFNYNPFGKYINDCAIRAISAATGLDYREVCKMLKCKCKDGYGLVRDTGVKLKDVRKVFNSYFDVIEDFYADFNFVPDEFKGSEEDEAIRQFEIKHGLYDQASGMTLNDFIDFYAGQGTFLVALIGNPHAKNPSCRGDIGHLVCVKCNPGFKQGFIDLWDSGEMLVDSFMRVKKFEPKDSPRHWRYDREKHKFIV